MKHTLKENSFYIKIIALFSLIFGNRAKQFDIIFEKLPDPKKLKKILNEKIKIKNIIFDLDGTLVAEYGKVNKKTIEYLKKSKELFNEVFIFSNSKPSNRYIILEKNGFAPFSTSHIKPSKYGFKDLAKTHNIKLSQTAMIGNFAITDAPLGKKKIIGANILIKSKGPTKESMENKKKLFFAKIIHGLSMLSIKIVKIRNRKISEIKA